MPSRGDAAEVSHTRPTAASSCHRCTHADTREAAVATPPLPPCTPPRALAAMASSYGRTTHALQAWSAGCNAHGHKRTVSSPGLRQGASRLGGGRGRAFDRRSRLHLDELRPLLLHPPRPIASGEHCLKERPLLCRSCACTASIREAAQHMGPAHMIHGRSGASRPRVHTLRHALGRFEACQRLTKVVDHHWLAAG